MRNKLDMLSDEVLSQLEFSEAGLLTWGFIGGTFIAEEEIKKILQTLPTPRMKELWEEALNEGTSINDIERNLIERKLIFNSKGNSRTRFAETIRLLYLLKQRFNFDDWQSASNLISNIKLLLKYRSYPKRDRDFTFLISKLKSKNIDEEFMIKIFSLLLDKGKMLLSKFQVDSTVSLISNIKSSNDTAVIIGAGTGSGKTKAFYIPALAYISKSIETDKSNWTRTLALYPRTELLKDQFKESIIEVQKLNIFMKNNNLRTISVGAYYGDTPQKAEDVEKSKYYKWEEKGSGYVCPFLTCPDCGGALIWLRQDQTKEVQNNKNEIYGEYEVLHCEDCSHIISSENIMLTRNRMSETPPDILFTTTEMLNRKLFSSKDRHVFGVNTTKPPKFVLLDEVHIYEGVTGAQVAYLLRRWRNLINLYNKWNNVQFVGLSATLTDPVSFFSTLVGISERNIEYITPEEEDLTDESMEYNMVLRGDPMSETSLLSTTVQTTMLLGRMLDPLTDEEFEGTFGPKIFGFTDKLDVINRWYHIEVDAEKNKTLSQYRDSNLIKKFKLNLVETFKQQQAMGQIWRVAQAIDPECLIKPLKVGITSSQTKGVDPKAKLVIATSTLEVGYNDPKVGAVIQHKAPRSVASFLQRKGRAGRTRGMRPWTIIVTSAYGRDRWIYENPQMVFDAVVPKLNLPIRNTYVEHIQAAFALMDWITHSLSTKGFKDINVWKLLTPKHRGYYKKAKETVVELLSNVISGDYLNMEKFIGDALILNETALRRVLWSPPRSIMFNLIPSLIAELKSDWNRTIENGNVICPEKSFLEDAPLTGFVPRSLFSSLEESDLMLMIPGKDELENLGLRQGMVEFAPGNVSKRYSNLRRLGSAQWIPITKEIKDIDVINFDNMRTEYVDTVANENGEVLVYRIKLLELEDIPKEISDRSVSYLKWNVNMKPNGDDYSEENKGKAIKFIDGSALKDVIENIEVFSSDSNQYVLCTRYARNLDSVLKYKPHYGSPEKIKIDFKAGKNNAALGFQGYVDGVSVRYKHSNMKDLMEKEHWNNILRELRPEYYLYLLKQDEYLSDLLSVFELEWLWQICISSVIAISISLGIDLESGIASYKNNLIPISERTLQAIFQTINVPEYEIGENEEGKLYKRLLGYLNDKVIAEILLTKIQSLYTEITIEKDFWDWVNQRYVSTLAATIKIAIDNISPDINTEDLLVDICDDVIWITEPDSGGMGIINSIAQCINSYPRRFEEVFMNSISYCSRHEISKDLDAVTFKIDDDIIRSDFYKVRTSSTLNEQKETLLSLQKHLFSMGITPRRELIVSMITKMLNANSSVETDNLIKKINSKWKEEQERLGCNFDLRIFSVACIKIENIKDEIDSILNKIDPSARTIEIGEKQRFSLVESMMWSDCLDSCPDCVQIYSPYSSFIKPSRSILAALLKRDYEDISYYDSKWKEQLIKGLIKGVKGRIYFDYIDAEDCRKHILNFVVVPIEVEYELLYPYIDSIKISDTKCYIDIAIKEGLHA